MSQNEDQHDEAVPGMVVASATVLVAGHDVMLKAGRLYPSDDPVVVERPDLFEPTEEYQRRKVRPQSTADLGGPLMRRSGGAETARSAPGDEQPVAFPCPKRDEAGCEKTFDTIRGAKAHGKAAHQ